MQLLSLLAALCLLSWYGGDAYTKTRLPVRMPFSSLSPKTTQRESTTGAVDKDSDEDKTLDSRRIPSKPLRIVIAGPPGGGKGTQCELLREKYGLVHLSTGELLRQAVQSSSSLGKQAECYMKEAKLVPDDLINGIVCERLQQSDCLERGWLLDGFPRTAAQAQALIDAGLTPDSFILFEVQESDLVDRIVHRRMDPVSGKIYHLVTLPPESEEIAARLIQRSDDTVEKVKRRLADYRSNIESVQSYFRSCTKVIDGSQSREAISAAIFEHLDRIITTGEVLSPNP